MPALSVPLQLLHYPVHVVGGETERDQIISLLPVPPPPPRPTPSAARVAEWLQTFPPPLLCWTPRFISPSTPFSH